jgi:transcriptional regulator with XRE-family HTH domain
MVSRKERATRIVIPPKGRGIGEKLRALRKHRRLTLGNLSERTGYSVSALSKMENERLGLTYDKLTRLAAAFQIDISALFTDGRLIESPQAAGRRSIARKGSGKGISTGNYDYLYVAPELSRKHMIPIVVKVRATSIEDFGPLIRHGGEEWIYVTKGEIEVHSEFYQPERLGEGDSVYLDSRMGHAYICKSKRGAEIVSVCSAPESELLENVDAQTGPRRPQRVKVQRVKAR